MTDEPEVTVTEHLDRPPKIRFEVSARQGEHAGWALGKTEQEARGKALLRLKAEVEGWWGPR